MTAEVRCLCLYVSVTVRTARVPPFKVRMSRQLCRAKWEESQPYSWMERERKVCLWRQKQRKGHPEGPVFGWGEISTLQKGLIYKLVHTARGARDRHWKTLRCDGQLEHTFRKTIPDYSFCFALVVATPYAALPKGNRATELSDIMVVMSTCLGITWFKMAAPI